MRWSELSFRAPRSTGLVGWALLVAGVLACATVADEVNFLEEQIQVRQARVKAKEALLAKRQPAKKTATTPEDPTVPQVLAQWQRWQALDWDRLFQVLESASSADIAILAVQPDPAKGRVDIQAEARNLAAALRWMEQLQSGLPGLTLATHQQQLQDPQQPVRVSLTAPWGAGEQR